MILGIDHGYYAIKTRNCSFPAGITPCGSQEPYTRQNVLTFGGGFFVCGSRSSLLTRHFRIGVDGYKHKHNTDILDVGGSGAGKTRTYAVPNVLEAARAGPGGKGCSLVLTAPKLKILRKTGAYLIRKGYEVRVFDLIDPNASFCYNPFVYVQDDKDVLQLITNQFNPEHNAAPRAEQRPILREVRDRAAAGPHALSAARGPAAGTKLRHGHGAIGER